MTLHQFIRDHRAEIDECIAVALGQDHSPLKTDSERRLWLLNDEIMYNWARRSGVNI